MADDNLDNGDAAVLVLLNGQGRLDEDRLVLPGGGAAEVFLDEDGDTLVQVETGKVRTHELARAVLRSPALTVYGELLDLVVATTSNDYDRFVMSSDLDHRFLWTRQWHEREEAGAPVVALVGHAPTRTETHGGDARHDQLVAALELAGGELEGDPAKLHVLDVFTRRVDGPKHLRGKPTERRADAGQRAEALAEADVVIAAWGDVADAGDFAVEAMMDELAKAREAGARVLVPADGDEPATVGSAPHPAALPGPDGLVEPSAEWLHGGQLA